MKTLTVLASLAALAAFALSSLSFESATSALFAVGFVAIALSDYSRQARPLTVDGVAARRTERLGLAA